ncbi:hypothetical protein SALB1_3516 [Salinisphaera sp. LB1]|nr:hypothetical protein SALB1_3516 [Salinisphaera sp. LB1]
MLARDTLLDAISGLECAAADRGVYFIVHCLRQKLADSARDPLYIATRYGKGYVGIGPSAPAERPADGEFIVVGPMHGLKFAEDLMAPAFISICWYSRARPRWRCTRAAPQCSTSCTA